MSETRRSNSSGFTFPARLSPRPSRLCAKQEKRKIGLETLFGDGERERQDDFTPGFQGRHSHRQSTHERNLFLQYYHHCTRHLDERRCIHTGGVTISLRRVTLAEHGGWGVHPRRILEQRKSASKTDLKEYF